LNLVHTLKAIGPYLELQYMLLDRGRVHHISATNRHHKQAI